MIILLIAIQGVYSYFGLEEVYVTEKNNQFRGVIAQIPHTSQIILWVCDNELKQTNLQTYQQKGILPNYIDYQKIIIEKTEGKDVLTLISKSHKIQIKYMTLLDKEYSYDLIEQIKHNINHKKEIDHFQVQENMVGMNDYLESFCNRDLLYPAINQFEL